MRSADRTAPFNTFRHQKIDQPPLSFTGSVAALAFGGVVKGAGLISSRTPFASAPARRQLAQQGGAIYLGVHLVYSRCQRLRVPFGDVYKRQVHDAAV